MPQYPKTGSTVPSHRTNSHLQIVTAPTADTPGAAVVLHFEGQRYVFGQVSEGFQRACIQRGIGLRRVRNLFLSGPTEWKTNGGLIGLILCLADVQLTSEAANSEPTVRERLHIHGAPRLLHSIACARRFVFRTGMPLTIHESKGLDFQWQDRPTYADDNVRVWSIPIHCGPAGQSEMLGHRSLLEDPKQGISDAGKTAVVTDFPHLYLEQEQALRMKVVSDMFESDWRRDKLFERAFKDVKMPATVWIRNSETKNLQGYRCLTHDSAPNILPEQTVLVRDPWPAALVDDLPSASNLPDKLSVSYIVKGYPQRGTFDKAKAQALGVNPGPAYRELTSGASIELEDGRVITPDMVLGPTQEGTGFAFFDIPSPNHLAHLKMQLDTQPAGMLHGVSAIVWLLGPGVSSGVAFKEVLESIPDVDHHLADVATSPNRIALESVALSQLLVASVAPHHFPPLNFSNTGPYEEQDTQTFEDKFLLSTAETNMSLAKPGVKLSIQPTYKADDSAVPPPFSADDIEDKQLAQTLKDQLKDESYQYVNNADLTEPEIITLGTGSAQPAKYRNVSATLLRMPGNQGNYLFDCGENTIGQLKRMYSASALRDVLQNLRAIWISHLHADHHLGTISVFQQRAQAFEGLGPDSDRTIYLISEKAMQEYIREYSSVEPTLITDTGLVPIVCSQDDGPTLHRQPFSFEDHSSCAIQRVQSVRVSHCAGAQAVSITFKANSTSNDDTFKISYSGDCRPSSRFCRIGLNSDVLIHEATFDNDMEGDAMAKKHSTTAEALGVAISMRAKNVVLTHFSQRYHKIPNFDNIKLPDEIKFEEGAAGEEQGPVDNGSTAPVTEQDVENAPRNPPTSQDNATPSTFTDHAQPPHETTPSPPPMHIAVAFDYMRFTISEIEGLKHLYPKIQALFDEQERKADEEKEDNKRKMEERLERKRALHTGKRNFADKAKSALKGNGKGRGRGRAEKNDQGQANGSVTANGEKHHHIIDPTATGTEAEQDQRQGQIHKSQVPAQSQAQSSSSSKHPLNAGADSETNPDDNTERLSKTQLKKRAKKERSRERKRLRRSLSPVTPPLSSMSSASATARATATVSAATTQSEPKNQRRETSL